MTVFLRSSSDSPVPLPGSFSDQAYFVKENVLQAGGAGFVEEANRNNSHGG